MVWHRLEAERHPRHSNAETQGAIISTIVRRSASHAVLDALRPLWQRRASRTISVRHVLSGPLRAFWRT
ncbi:hypothetical protein CU664_21580 [Pseudomonas syringae pv. actinidifoliorum]|nr:hypothetical protein [Pseudomonas syringae pv. actinidifoliorum]